MKRLFFDIEAVPLEKEVERTPTFKEKLLRRKVKKSPPVTQKIICIAYALDDENVEVISSEEKEMLKTFWQIAEKVEIFAGFGIFDYDLKLIWQRSIILGVKPTKNITFIKGTSAPIYDIAYEWSKWTGGVGSKISLDNLAKLLQLPSPKNGDVNGRTVARAYADGKLQQICEYCARDVETTRSVYKKINI